MRAARTWVAACAALLWAACAAAAPPPRLELGLGMTGGSSDGPQEPGASATLSALWPFAGIELGPMFFAEDLGTSTERLYDPNDGTDLGAVAGDHRVTFGGAWRVDVPFALNATWVARGSGAWGYYRIQEDQIGQVEGAISALGMSVGAGVSRRLFSSTEIGLSARYHRLFDDRQDHFFSASVDLAWLPWAASASRTPRTATPGNEN